MTLVFSPNQRMTAGLFQRVTDYITAAAAQLYFKNSISLFCLYRSSVGTYWQISDEYEYNSQIKPSEKTKNGCLQSIILL